MSWSRWDIRSGGRRPDQRHTGITVEYDSQGRPARFSGGSDPRGEGWPPDTRDQEQRFQPQFGQTGHFSSGRVARRSWQIVW